MAATKSFNANISLPVSAEEAFAWHERPGALDRLIPPWEPVEIAGRADGVKDGEQVILVLRIGPLKLRWVAEHSDYIDGKQFRDRQLSGPFAHWDHLHQFESSSAGSEMTDCVEYRIPGGALGRLLTKGHVERKVRRMFEYRHQTTKNDLAAHARHKEKGAMQIAITGARGMLGSELEPFLTTGGHETTKIVRGEPGQGELSWDPTAEQFDAAVLDGMDAVVHLAGENIAARRWSKAQKARIVESRTRGTRILCEGLARMASPPKVLVAASATGFYGDRGDELVNEDSDSGTGFLAEVAHAWEEATRPAVEAGIRVVNLRFGMILSPKGGALKKMLTPFKLGGGGVVGSGKQYYSWISIDDAVGAIHHALMTDSLTGPVNAVTPNPVTNREFTKTLGRVLRRPTIIPLPGFAARLVFGELAQELLLNGQRVEPRRLLDSGYEFRHGELEAALRHLLGR